jgi:hypothetical protein
LQQGLEAIQDAGASLIALSYDEPDALAAFSESYSITFPMLSDPDSSVIRSFGILNTLIAEDDHPWFGIPFPGVYVVGADGIIMAKFFENHLALRPGVDQLIRAVEGEAVSLATREPVAEVECQVAIDDAPVAPGIVRELMVRLRVPEGQHLYGNPVPAGMVATQVEVDAGDGLIVLDTIAPPTRPLTLDGTGETLQVYEGDVVLRVPFSHSATILGADAGEGGGALTISGCVRWQACDDAACGLPASAPFRFTIDLAPMSQLRFGDVKDGEMDSGPFLHQMTQRRTAGD